MESNNASFFEHVYPLKSNDDRTSSSKRILDDINKDDSYQDEKINNLAGSDFYVYMIDAEPQSYKEATSSIEGPLWKEPIRSEISFIMQMTLRNWFIYHLDVKI